MQIRLALSFEAIRDRYSEPEPEPEPLGEVTTKGAHSLELSYQQDEHEVRLGFQPNGGSR